MDSDDDDSDIEDNPQIEQNDMPRAAPVRRGSGSGMVPPPRLPTPTDQPAPSAPPGLETCDPGVHRQAPAALLFDSDDEDGFDGDAGPGAAVAPRHHGHSAMAAAAASATAAAPASALAGSGAPGFTDIFGDDELGGAAAVAKKRQLEEARAEAARFRKALDAEEAGLLSAKPPLPGAASVGLEVPAADMYAHLSPELVASMQKNPALAESIKGAMATMEEAEEKQRQVSEMEKRNAANIRAAFVAFRNEVDAWQQAREEWCDRMEDLAVKRTQAAEAAAAVARDQFEDMKKRVDKVQAESKARMLRLKREAAKLKKQREAEAEENEEERARLQRDIDAKNKAWEEEKALADARASKLREQELEQEAESKRLTEEIRKAEAARLAAEEETRRQEAEAERQKEELEEQHREALARQEAARQEALEAGEREKKRLEGLRAKDKAEQEKIHRQLKDVADQAQKLTEEAKRAAEEAARQRAEAERLREEDRQITLRLAQERVQTNLLFSGVEPASKVVFVVDHSGSMCGPEWARAAKEACSACDVLQPHRRLFGIVAFTHTTSQCWENLHVATVEHVNAAREWISGLRAGGGTDFQLAIKAGLAVLQSTASSADIAEAAKAAAPKTLEGAASATAARGKPQMFFITDGQATLREQDYAAVKAADVQVICVGIGIKHNAELERLATETGGTMKYVPLSS